MSIYDDYLAHHGIKGQKWGVRRFQNEDGSLTSAGRERYGSKPKGDRPPNVGGKAPRSTKVKGDRPPNVGGKAPRLAEGRKQKSLWQEMSKAEKAQIIASAGIAVAGFGIAAWSLHRMKNSANGTVIDLGEGEVVNQLSSMKALPSPKAERIVEGSTFARAALGEGVPYNTRPSKPITPEDMSREAFRKARGIPNSNEETFGKHRSYHGFTSSKTPGSNELPVAEGRRANIRGKSESNSTSSTKSTKGIRQRMLSRKTSNSTLESRGLGDHTISDAISSVNGSGYKEVKYKPDNTRHSVKYTNFRFGQRRG